MEFTREDVPVIRAAADVLGKACDAAVAALAKLRLDATHVNAIESRNEAIKHAMDKTVDHPTFAMPDALGATLRLGLQLEREQVEKIVKAQITLEIEPNDNQARLEGIKRCEQIASGQVSLV
jgi:hypothetical protein